MRASVRNAFVAFSSPLEGVVPYMYADIKGLVTTAIGILIDPIHHALRLPWRRFDGSMATASEIAADFSAIRSSPLAAKHGHRYAKQLVNLHLDEQGVQDAVDGKMTIFDTYLRSRFPDWESWPADAQLATMSMSWACGPAFRFPALDAALRDQDWKRAALHCKINTAGNPGIVPRNAANVGLYLNAARSVAEGLDPDTLLWPSFSEADDPDTKVTTGELGTEEFPWAPKVYVDET